MKHVLPLIICLSIAASANAQTQKREEPLLQKNVTITVDMIGVSRVDAFSLVRLNSAAMWTKLGEMITAGTAKSEYIMSITGISGERNTLECINETRYPTEFEPPLDPAKAIDEAQTATNPPPSELMRTQIIPTAFETRNVGGSMEVTPSIRGNKIALEIIPSQTLLDRFISYPLGFEKSLLRADQPQFQTFKVQTKVVLDSGKPLFLGAGDQSPSHEGKNADRVLIFFVTGTIDSE